MRTHATILAVAMGCSPPSAPSAPPATSPVPSPPAESVPPSSPPPAKPVAAWVEAAVEEALWAEVMPGSTDEPAPGRKAALRTFFEAHPEYRDPDKREPLWAHACGLGGVEGAHKWLTHPPPKTPEVVTVDTDDWKVFAAFTDHHCTSDDWAWTTAETNQAAMEHGAVTGYGNADNNVLVVKLKNKEVARLTFEGTGYVALRAGQKPLAMDDGALEPAEAFDGYFGVRTNQEASR